MNMKQVWSMAGGFFLVYVLITLTNKPQVAPADAPAGGEVREESRNEGTRGAEPAAPLLGTGDFQKGFVYLSPGATQLGNTSSDQQLAALAATGADWVAFSPVLYQDTGDAMAIAPDPALTPTISALTHAVDAAHQTGLKVMLRPLVVARDGTLRQGFNPADPGAWLTAYEAALQPYLKIARERSVELVSLGAAYSGLENTAPWPDLIRRAREGFSGRLTYGAAFQSSGNGGYRQVPFWSQLDFVGIEAFFPLTTAATADMEALSQGWRTAADEIEAWAAGHGTQGVVITGVGMPALQGAAQAPDRPTPGAAADPGVQAESCEAFFRAMAGRTWLKGAYWYAWEDPGSGAASPYAVQAQPALAVLQRYYGRPVQDR